MVAGVSPLLWPFRARGHNKWGLVHLKTTGNLNLPLDVLFPFRCFFPVVFPKCFSPPWGDRGRGALSCWELLISSGVTGAHCGARLCDDFLLHGNAGECEALHIFVREMNKMGSV